MKKSIFYIIIVLATLACKKSNSTYTPPTTLTTHSNTPVDSGYQILISTSKVQTVISGSLTNTFNSTTAYFSSVLTSYGNPTTAVKVNTVNLNGTFLKFNSSSYIDTTGTISLPPILLTVNGANGIPSFTYTNSNPFSTYTGYNSLPDTIYRNQINTLNLTGVINADHVDVLINDGTSYFATGNSISTTSTTFSLSNLSKLQATNSGTIYVILNNSEIETIAGKRLSFSYLYQVTRTVVIK